MKRGIAAICLLCLLAMGLPAFGEAAEPSLNALLLSDGFAGTVYSACRYQDGMAVLGVNGVFLWRPESGENTRLLDGSALGNIWDLRLLTLAGRLLLLDRGTGVFSAIENGALTPVYALTPEVMTYTEDGEDTPLNRQITDAVATGDAVYVLANSFRYNAGSVYELYAVTGDFAQVKKLDVAQIERIDSASGEGLVVAWREDGALYPALYDPLQKRVVRKWPEVNADEATGFVWDSERETLYYLGALGRVYALPAQGEARVCACLPLDFSWGGAAALWPERNAYLYQGSGAVFVRAILPEGEAAMAAVRIAGDVDDGVLMRYAAQHPDVTVMLDNRASDFLGVQQAMVAGDDSIDLYVFDSDNLYAQALEKGYAAPLNESAALLERARNLYPYARDAVFDGERLMAFPVSADIACWTYNRTQFAAMGLGEMPESYAAFYALAEKWRDEFADNEAYYCLARFSDGLEGAVRFMIRQYLLAHENWQTAINFDTEAFRQTLRDAWEHRDAFVSEDKMELIMDYPQYLGTGHNDGDIVASCLPPALSDDEPRLARATLKLAVVNPASKQKETAIDFLTFYATHMGEERYELFSDCVEPLRAANYEALAEQYGAALAELEAQLAACETAVETQEISDAIAALRLRMTDNEENGWRITAEDIAVFQAIAAHAVAPLRTIYPQNDSAQTQSLDALVSLFASGQMKAEEFTRQLSERAKMIYSEMK